MAAQHDDILYLTKQLKKSQRNSRSNNDTAEKKIVIVLVYYILLAAISLVAFSLSIKSTNHFIDEALNILSVRAMEFIPITTVISTLTAI